MRALVHFRLPDGSTDVLGPGDVIGRMWTASLRLDDPGVSEAHALISLRGETLKLLALRGRFMVDGQLSTEVDLRPGQKIQLSQETELVVTDVILPMEVMAIEGDGLPRQVLVGPCALRLKPHPQLLPGYEATADAVLWGTGDGWRLRIGHTPARALLSGDSWTIDGLHFRAVAVSLSHAAQDRTRHDISFEGPLHIVTLYDTVHIYRTGKETAILSGQSARIVSELAAMGNSAPWEVLARELFPGPIDREALRRKWDVSILRLRARLRELGLRPDLVRPSRSGQLELVLLSSDTIEERS